MSHQFNRDATQMLAQVDANDGGAQIVDPTHNLFSSATIRLDIPADVQYVNVLGASISAFLINLEQLAEPETTIYNLELAVQEVSVNIATHAYANAHGRIYMTASLSHQPLRLTILLQDTGLSFDPAQVPQPRFGELQEHGYGLFLVTQLMDEVEYHRIEGGSVWKLLKNLPVTQQS
ncbi:ATP-binding protein [soil metagenome]